MCHMGAPHDVNQRDLRLRSREIMDAVERGASFTVTRDGRRIGELIPLRTPKRFVSRDDFAQASRTMPAIDPDRFRADLDALVDPSSVDPFDRAGR